MIKANGFLGLILPFFIIGIKIVLLEEEYTKLTLVLLAELLSTTHLLAQNSATACERRCILATVEKALAVVILGLTPSFWVQIR